MIRANLFKNLFKQKFHNICPYCYLGKKKYFNFRIQNNIINKSKKIFQIHKKNKNS